MLELAQGMETDSALAYNKWANECAAHADSVSKKLFEDLVVDEERHFDQYDTELEHMGEFGDSYLALAVHRAEQESGSGATRGVIKPLLPDSSCI